MYVYVRVQRLDGKVNTQLIIAKSRVTPLKRVTIPGLELCGALLLAQLAHYCLSIYTQLNLSMVR